MDKGRDQGKYILSLFSIALIVFMCTMILISFVVAVELRGSNDIALYFRDPATTYNYWPTAGLFSYIGIFVLTTAAVIGVFSFFYAPQENSLHLSFGLFSLILALDDLFLFHEALAPRWLGVLETNIFLTYAIIALALIVRHLSSLVGKAHFGLYLSIVFLAASIFVDKLDPEIFSYRIVFEDGFKLTGYVLWSSYWVRRAGRAFSSRPLTSPVLGRVDGRSAL